MLHVPYVGNGVLASAICMDKAVQKQLCVGVGLPVVPFIALTPNQPIETKNLKYPLFIKPSNQGSSVGVTKVHNQSELNQAVAVAFRYDTKILIEQGITEAREIECAILGPTTQPEASVLGEIISSNEFYDYDAKYIDGQSQAIIPAKLPKPLAEKIQSTAKTAFSLCNAYGLARVDFLLSRVGDYYLSELNTMPGFTTISMYPKLWETSGLSYPTLLDRLITLALARHHSRSGISLSYHPKTSWHRE